MAEMTERDRRLQEIAVQIGELTKRTRVRLGELFAEARQVAGSRQAFREWVESSTEYTAKYAEDLVSAAGTGRFLLEKKSDKDRQGLYQLRSEVRAAPVDLLGQTLEERIACDPEAFQAVEQIMERQYEKRTAQRNQEFLDKKWGEAGYTPEEAEQVRAERLAQLERIAMPARASEEFVLLSGAMAKVLHHLKTIGVKYATALDDEHLDRLRGWIEELRNVVDAIERKRADAQRFAARRVG